MGRDEVKCHEVSYSKVDDEGEEEEYNDKNQCDETQCKEGNREEDEEDENGADEGAKRISTRARGPAGEVEAGTSVVVLVEQRVLIRRQSKRTENTTSRCLELSYRPLTDIVSRDRPSPAFVVTSPSRGGPTATPFTFTHPDLSPSLNDSPISVWREGDASPASRAGPGGLGREGSLAGDLA